MDEEVLVPFGGEQPLEPKVRKRVDDFQSVFSYVGVVY